MTAGMKARSVSLATCLLMASVVTLAGLLTSEAADAAKRAKPPKAPSGKRFYNPPKKLIRKGKAGTPIWTRAARGLARPAGARKVLTVAYRSTSIRNRKTVMTGTVAVPKGKAPRGGWPVVAFGHVTTGGADSCAPSRVTRGNTELERLTRGDSYVSYLLRKRVAVVRPDFEGIGTPGRHPYLIGNSLGRSMVDLVLAGRKLKLGLGKRWAAAGHSEGGQAALFAARVGPRRAPQLSLRAASAFAPGSHIRDIMEMARQFKTVSPLTADFSGLGALILEGVAVAEPSLWKAYRNGGLSRDALALMPHTQKYCLTDLARPGSFGGIAPGNLEGEKAEEILPKIYAVTDRNDPRTLKLPGLPVRLDQGANDLVVWVSHTTEVGDALAASGAKVTLEVWPGGTHENITAPDYAGPAAADWLIAKLR